MRPSCPTFDIIFFLVDPNSSNLEKCDFSFCTFFQTQKPQSLIENQIQFHVHITHSPKTALPKTGDCTGIEIVQQIQIVDDCKYRVLKTN